MGWRAMAQQSSALWGSGRMDNIDSLSLNDNNFMISSWTRACFTLRVFQQPTSLQGQQDVSVSRPSASSVERRPRSPGWATRPSCWKLVFGYYDPKQSSTPVHAPHVTLNAHMNNDNNALSVYIYFIDVTSEAWNNSHSIIHSLGNLSWTQRSGTVMTTRVD